MSRLRFGLAHVHRELQRDWNRTMIVSGFVQTYTEHSARGGSSISQRTAIRNDVRYRDRVCGANSVAAVRGSPRGPCHLPKSYAGGTEVACGQSVLLIASGGAILSVMTVSRSCL
jgi:hypothetical protein